MREVRSSILVIVAVLVSIGNVMIYSASAIYAYGNIGDSLYFLKRHLLYLLIGIVLIGGPVGIALLARRSAALAA